MRSYFLAVLVFSIISLFNSKSFSMDIFQAVRENDIKKIIEGGLICKKNVFEEQYQKTVGCTYEFFKPLHMAVMGERQQIAEIFLAAGADVNVESSVHRITPLHIAAQMRMEEMAYLLVKNGADINKKTRRAGITPLENTPFHAAAIAGSIRLVELFVERGANINEKNHDQETALSLALKKRYVKIADYLSRCQEKQNELFLLIKDEDYEKENLQRINKLMLDEETPLFAKKKAFFQTIKLYKKNKNERNEGLFDIKKYFNQIAFDYYFFRRPAFLRFLSENKMLDVKDSHGRTIEQAFCFFPSTKTISTFFSSFWILYAYSRMCLRKFLSLEEIGEGDEDIVKTLMLALKIAKKKRWKKFVVNLYNICIVLDMLTGKELEGKLLLDLGIVSHIIGFSDGDFGRKIYYEHQGPAKRFSSFLFSRCLESKKQNSEDSLKKKKIM